jgi:hypothetical protein
MLMEGYWGVARGIMCMGGMRYGERRCNKQGCQCTGKEKERVQEDMFDKLSAYTMGCKRRLCPVTVCIYGVMSGIFLCFRRGKRGDVNRYCTQDMEFQCTSIGFTTTSTSTIL